MLNMGEKIITYNLATRTSSLSSNEVVNAVRVYRENNAKIYDKSRILPQYFLGEDGVAFSLYPYCGSCASFILSTSSDPLLVFVFSETYDVHSDPFADVPKTLTLYLSKSGELMVKGKQGDVSIGYYRSMKRAMTSV